MMVLWPNGAQFEVIGKWSISNKLRESFGKVDVSSNYHQTIPKFG